MSRRYPYPAGLDTVLPLNPCWHRVFRLRFILTHTRFLSLSLSLFKSLSRAARRTPSSNGIPTESEIEQFQRVSDMSTIVDIWVSEVMRLQAKRRQPASRSGKADPAAEEEGHQKQQQQQPQQQEALREQAARRTTTLSEATVCMLMDRFAPC